MKFFNGRTGKEEAVAGTAFEKDGLSPTGTPTTLTPKRLSEDPNVVVSSPAEAEGKVTVIAVLLGAIASVGGFIFGYESGQISGTYPSLFRPAEHWLNHTSRVSPDV